MQILKNDGTHQAQNAHSARPDDSVTTWDRQGEMYDSIEPLELRREDVSRYPVHRSLLWGKVLGTSDLNGRMLTGSFAGGNKDICSTDDVSRVYFTIRLV
jgi:hypothetical protein